MRPDASGPFPVWQRHWPEYTIEAALLGLFMVSACLFSVLLFYPEWPGVRSIPDFFARRVLMGLAMGSTAIALNYSAWGKQSGAHYNPAVTLTFTRLGKVAPWDAAAYVAAQFIGAVVGVMAARSLLQMMLADDQVHFDVLERNEPSPISPRDDAFALLESTIGELFPDAVPAPYVMMATTDSRHFTRICDRVYRFAPFRMTKAQRESIHSYDEHLGVDAFLDGIRWYRRLIERLPR